MVTMTIRSRALFMICVVLLLGACREAPADSAAAHPDATPPLAARFACDQVAVAATFHGDRVELQLPNRTLTLPQVVAASGARYSDGSNTFWNMGREATFELDGQTQSCREVRDPGLEATGHGIGTAPDSRWRVTARGLGPVRVGMTTAEASTALGMPLTGVDATAECIDVRPSRELAGVTFMVVNGAIARVDVSAGDVATEEGVRIGDSTERVGEVYAGRVTASPHKYTDGEYLTIAPDAQHRIVFEVERQHVTRYRGGRLPEVEWVEGCS